MVLEKLTNEFVSRLRQVAGENLRSVIVYGSAADGEFHPQFSDVNLLCILGDVSFSTLSAVAPAVEWWRRQKQPAPLLLTREELERSADVFAIEMLDMQRQHRVVFGDDVLSGLNIPMQLHRAQVEYELREKLIVLRESLLSAAGHKERMWTLLLGSVSAFVTLFRHALIALGQSAPDSKREAVRALAASIPFDASAFLQVLDVRERKVERRQLDVSSVFARYLEAVQQVTSAVDTMLAAKGP